VLLVDVVMESPRAGLELVQWVRETLGDKQVRIILRTGQPDDVPELLVMQQYEINDYLNKIDCQASRLACALFAALRSAQEIRAVVQQQQLHAVRDLLLNQLGQQLAIPLQAIIGHADLGLAQAPDLAQTACLRHIQQAAAQVQGIFADLQDFSRLRGGVVPLQPSGCRPPELVDALLAQFRLGNAGGCYLEADIAPEVPGGIWVDQRRLQQALATLLHRAIKNSQAGTVVLQLLLVEDNTILRFQIRDNGVGYSAAQSEHWRQLWHSESLVCQADDFDLLLCYQQVRLLKATLDFSSEPGRGSCFWLDLPLQRWHGMVSGEQTPATVQSVATELPGPRILVVDDSAANLEIACALLQNAGFAVDGISDGLTALTMLRQADYAAILMDVQMPGLDGFATTTRVRQLEQGAVIPIIAITAHATAGYREQCLASGMNDYLTKPVDAETLIRTVRRWVGTASLPALPVWQDELALRRLGGNQALLNKLISDFISEHNVNQPERIRASLQQGEIAVASRMLHTLKGESGTLAAVELHQQAIRLEQQLAAGQAWQSQWQQLQSAFERLAAECRRRLPAAPVSRQPVAAEPAAAFAALQQDYAEPALLPPLSLQIAEQLLLRQLDQLLAQQNLAAELVLQQLIQGGNPALGRALDPVAQALLTFDFASARRSCQCIYAAAGISS
jgi:CheY-like chemotaxis protein/signal transduction histidine kinase